MTESAPAGHYGRGHRALEIGSIVFVFAALGWLAYRVWSAASTGGDWIWITVATFAGYLVADFLSGFVHWAGDTVGDESTPLFGNSFVRPFRYHHVDPEDITRHDFVETNGNNCIVVAPVLLLLLLVMPRTAEGWFFGGVVAVSTTWFVFCTNQFHKWAHNPSPARWVRLLQRAGLILSPEHHAVHHAAPQDKYYCITVGWMNPVLERMRFFRILEAVIGRLAPGALRPDLR